MYNYTTAECVGGGGGEWRGKLLEKLFDHPHHRIHVVGGGMLYYCDVTCTILMCESLYLPISMICLNESEYDKKRDSNCRISLNSREIFFIKDSFLILRYIPWKS